MAKYIFSGAEDSGKSYQLALAAGRLAERNHAWMKITGKPRSITSNLHFQPWFREYVEDKLGVPIKYWKDVEELPYMTGTDLIWDETGVALDSRNYKDLPADVRFWLAQASKLGVDIYGSAQDFAQVDISFRRLVSEDTGGLFHISKLIGSPRPHETKPPVKRIWGLCMMRKLDPVGYDEQSKKFSKDDIMPSFFLIRKEICSIFDTNKRIAKSAPPPLKHIARRCSIAGCKLHRHEVINGEDYLITHV